jgi:nitroreductase
MDVKEAILGRKSIRKYLSKPIERDKLERVLEFSRRSPTWKNVQGYKIAIVEGNSRDELSRKFISAIEEGKTENPDFPFQEFYPNYTRKRMIELGSGYYGHLGVDRKDKEKRKELMLDNFKFFGAPTAVFFLMEKGMDYWPTLDLGILIGQFMIASRSEGLDTIAQASLAAFPDIVRTTLGLEEKWKVAVGISMGYADVEARENTFNSDRVPASEIISYFK